jgi:hypothetical protein
VSRKHSGEPMLSDPSTLEMLEGEREKEKMIIFEYQK